MTDVNIIKQKTKIGMVWNAIEKFSVQLVSFVISIVLARMLSPGDYGTVGLLTVFLTLANVFIDSGFSKGLIQKIDREEVDFSTTLIFNVVISIFLYLILFFCSPIIAKFYDNEMLIPLSRVLFIIIILNSLTVVQSAKLQISINFRSIAVINLITTIISGVVAIIAANNGLGVWALVIQQIVRNLCLVLLYWLLGKWIPRTGFSIKSFKSLFSYGSKLLLSGIVATVISNIHDLLIGKLFTTEKLGYYTRAMQYPVLITATLTGVLQTSTFPMLSVLQNDKNELLTIFKRLIKLTALCVYPAMFGLATVSKTMIVVLLTDKWLIAADYLFWLSLSSIFSPLQILNINLMNAIGRTDLSLKLDFIKAPVILLSICVTFPFGMKAVVIGKLFFAFIYYFIDCYMAYKMFNFGVFKQILASWKPLMASIIMALIIFLFNKIFIYETVLKLFLQFMIAIVIYFFMLFILKDEEFKIFIKKIIKK